MLSRPTWISFAWLVTREGPCSSSDFSSSAFTPSQLEVQARYPGLSGWRGIGGLKESLRLLAGSLPDLPVLLANRSAQLMKLAGRLLFQSCRNVLVTDIGWPPYHDILAAEGVRTGRTFTLVPVRDLVMRERTTEDEVLDAVRTHYLRQRCDGLFLTAVSHLGIRLPVEQLVRSLEEAREPRFVVIDGAQEFCHVSADLRNDFCDLYLAGCHKWLQAYHPMGLAFYGRRRSQFIIETALKDLVTAGQLDDPLLRFSKQLESDTLDGRTETVSLGCLFSCLGAVADALEEGGFPGQCLPRRLNSLTAAVGVAAENGWSSLLPPPRFRTGILLLQAERMKRKASSETELRHAFSEQGVALTAYDGGFIRLAMPAEGWRPGEMEYLRLALRATS